MNRFSLKLIRFMRGVWDAVKVLTKFGIYIALFIGPTVLAVVVENGNWIFLTLPTGVIAYGLSCAWGD